MVPFIRRTKKRCTLSTETEIDKNKSETLRIINEAKKSNEDFAHTLERNGITIWIARAAGSEQHRKRRA